MSRVIVLIGAGQLGSRHLQALALLTSPTIIRVIDPSSENLQVARQRFEEIVGHNVHDCQFLSSTSQLEQKSIDVAIIATNSAVRCEVIATLFKKSKVSYVILEKVLFQRISEYSEIAQLLLENGTKAFVNCPRRMFESYVDIKNELDGKGQIHIEVVGNNWGLGCNGIHFVDLFHFLTGEIIIKWNSDLEQVFDSKRAVYKEFSGWLFGKSEGGHQLRLGCFEKGTPNLSVRISTPSRRFIISEGLGEMVRETINEQWTSEYTKYQMQYQSALTNVVVEDLFNLGTCGLTSFKDSTELHIPFITTLLEYYNLDLSIKTDRCPIT